MFLKKNFNLTDEEYNEISQWANSHECKCRQKDKDSLSCCGGEISITFTPTAIGTLISAECICGNKIELDKPL